MKTISLEAQEAAEQVLVSQYRETKAIGNGEVQQIFDVLTCPGMMVVCTGTHIGDHFESEGQVYELSNGQQYDNAGEALLAWQDMQGDLEALDALGHALLRTKLGLIRPLWADRTPQDKAIWIAVARTFRSLLNSFGFEVTRRTTQ